MSSSAHRERHSTLALLLVPAALATTGALLALRLHFQPPTVPTYALASPIEQTSLHPSDRFEIQVRPSAPVSGAVGARAFLLRGNEVRPWDPPFQVGVDGSVRITGVVGSLFEAVPAGSWEIAVAVGRPETLPTAPRDVLRGRDANAGTAAWRLVRAGPVKIQ